jgi:hypothetical protein
MCKTYIRNLETSHIELHFEKSEYIAMLAEKKKLLRQNYHWSPKATAWVSRSTKNHYWAIEVAKKLGFTEEEVVGERLSFEEEVNRKIDKAERRAERYDGYADNAVGRAENLQSEFNKHRKDWSFITQPNINSSGGRRFTNYRNKIMNRYEKGFEEYRKSEYFRNKADTARSTAAMDKFKNRTYLYNRIEECEKNLRMYERSIVKAEELNNEDRVNMLLEKMEYEMDKLAYMKNCLDELGGIQYSKDNLKVGYLVKIRGRWCSVLKLNKKTVDTVIIEGGAKGFELRHPYAEIQEMKIPEGWTDKKDTFKNPFVINDILTRSSIGGKSILHAYQVVKTTAKTITIQEIEVNGNKPILNSFISDKKERKTVKKDRSNNFVVNDYGDWYLYKYVGELSA